MLQKEQRICERQEEFFKTIANNQLSDSSRQAVARIRTLEGRLRIQEKVIELEELKKAQELREERERQQRERQQRERQQREMAAREGVERVDGDETLTVERGVDRRTQETLDAEARKVADARVGTPGAKTILDIFVNREAGEQPTSQSIATLFNARTGKNVSAKHIRDYYLTPLVKAGLLKLTPVGKENIYQLDNDVRADIDAGSAFLVRALNLKLVKDVAYNRQRAADIFNNNRNNPEVMKFILDQAFTQAIKNLDQQQLGSFIKSVLDGGFQKAINLLGAFMQRPLTEGGLGVTIDPESLEMLQERLSLIPERGMVMDRLQLQNQLIALMTKHRPLANIVLQEWKKQFNITEAPKVEHEIYFGLTDLALGARLIGELFNLVGKENLNISTILTKEQKTDPRFASFADLAKRFYSFQNGKSVPESAKGRTLAKQLASVLYGDMVQAGIGNSQLLQEAQDRAPDKEFLKLDWHATGIEEIDSIILEVMVRALIQTDKKPSAYVRDMFKEGPFKGLVKINDKGLIQIQIIQILEKFQEDLKNEIELARAA